MNVKTPISLVAAVALFASCASYHVRKGDKAFSTMAYAKAQHHYDRALIHGGDRDVLLRAADACRSQNELAQAARYYHRADSLVVLTGDDALHHGQVLMGIGQHEAAAACFMRVLQERPEDGAALDLYGSCSGYKSFYADTARYVVNALTLPGIRTAFSAVPFKNGLLVTGEQEVPAARANPWNGLSFLDLYYCEKQTVARWLEARPLPGRVNGPFHEGPAVTGPDGRTLYFTRSNYVGRKLAKDATNTSHLKIFRATLDSLGAWTDIHAFSHNGEGFSTGHPAISDDGRTLYFASDRPGGFGGSDIWCSHDNGTGWSEPVNLGATVNSAGNELFPTVNGHSLYFSSTAHLNMGGLDIFETHEENGHWSEPANLNYPINTPHDDFGFALDTTEGDHGQRQLRGYLSSDRDGSDRVYAFTANEPTLDVEGTVTDDSDRFLPNTTVTLTEVLTGDEATVTTGANGEFAFELKADRDYVVKATHADRITRSRPLSTRGLSGNDTIRVAFTLDAIEIDRPIAINDIYYDYDKWDIRPDAAVELDKVARIFKDNPQLTFELNAHTDSRGGDMYNLVLSDARAYSAVNYLIQQGVDPDRIKGLGYGETMLVNQCKNGVKCTEEEHQANRRTEFKVTGIREVAQKR